MKAGLARDGFFLGLAETGQNYGSTFDTERIELINGPQAILYGGSGDGAVINIVSKQARLGQPAFGSFMYRDDQYGNKLGSSIMEWARIVSRCASQF